MKLAMKMPLGNYGPDLRIYSGCWVKVKSGAGFWCEVRGKYGEWAMVQSLTGSVNRTKSAINGVLTTAIVRFKNMSST